MTSIYEIYEPDMTSLDKLARITFWNKSFLEVFWNPVTHQIFFANRNQHHSKWFAQDEDSKIIDSLCQFLQVVKTHQVVADSFMVFDQSERHGKVYATDSLLHIYDCDWSDFACDRLVFHLNVRVSRRIKDRKEPALGSKLSA